MTKQYGLIQMGVIRVFRKDKQIQGRGKKTFTVSDVWYNVSEKEEDGTYFNRSVNLIFPRDTERPDNNTVIRIHESFPMITGEGDYRKIVYYVKEWEYEKE